MTRMCGHCGQAIPTTFGQRLKRARADRGLTLDQVQQRCGVHATNLGRYERDLVKPQLELAARIAEGLGVSVDWLLGLNGNGEV